MDNEDYYQQNFEKLRTEFILNIQIFLEQVYTTGIEPLRFNDETKKKLRGELDKILELARTYSMEPEGGLIFLEELLPKLIDNLGKLVKDLRVKAFDEIAERIKEDRYYETKVFTADLHHSAKQRVRNKNFKGETLSIWDNYLMEWTKDLEHYFSIITPSAVIAKSETILKKKPTKEKKDYKSLLEIWQQPEQHYNQVIEFLKKPNDETGLPFINNDGKWTEQIVLLGAFIRKCKTENYIGPEIKQATLERILSNTFLINISDTPSLRRKHVFSHDQEKAFEKLPRPIQPCSND